MRLSLLFAFVLGFPALALADLSFIPGHYYASGSDVSQTTTTITQINEQGAVVGSINLFGVVATEVHGLTFGPDGLLYAVIGQYFPPFAVVALSSSGAVLQSYPLSSYVGGNLSYGKIAIGGGYIFVASQDTVTRFVVGSPASGSVIYTGSQVFDVKILPSGNLLVCEASRLTEITAAGVLIRPFNTTTILGDAHAVEYHAPTNKVFISMLGYTNFFNQVMRFDYATAALETRVTFEYADDLFLDLNGNLIVGSRTQAPVVMDRDLNTLRPLGTAPQLFLTQYTILPSLLSVSKEVAGTRVRWKDLAANAPYRIEHSNLFSEPWQRFLGTIFTDSSGVLEFVDSGASEYAQRFYRPISTR